jgi:hypothetical protein
MNYLDEGDGLPDVTVHSNPTWSYSYRNLIKKLKRTPFSPSPPILNPVEATGLR